MGFSTVTSLITEAVKKYVKNFPVDLIVLIVSCIVGGMGTLAYYVIANMGFSITGGIYAVLMALATWLSAMLGYDKVIECIGQFKR